MPESSTTHKPECTLVLATKNRRDELRKALSSALAQTVVPEIVVNDDGSTDGTFDMVKAEFPMVKVGRSEVSCGSIVNRNKAVATASGRIIISIDDDAAFDSPRTIEQTIAEFDNPRVGAVAVPYIDVYINPAVRQAAPDTKRVYAVSAFRGCAAAWRRDVFLALGGYAEILIHMAEEEDLCQRLLGAGFITRLGSADPIHHFESPNRDPKRIIEKQARNAILMGWRNAPLVFLPLHLAKSSGFSVLRGAARGMGPQMVRGAAKGWGTIFSGKAARNPLSLRSYVLYHWLARHGPAALEQIEPRLAPPIDVQSKLSSTPAPTATKSA